MMRIVFYKVSDKTIMIIAIISLSIPSYVGGVDGDYVRGIAWGCSSKVEQVTVNLSSESYTVGSNPSLPANMA